MTQREFLGDPEKCTPEVLKQIMIAIRTSPRLSKVVHQHKNEVIIEAITYEAILFCSIINFIHNPLALMVEMSESQMADNALSIDPVIRLEKWLKNRN